MNGPELAEREMNADRLRVLAGVRVQLRRVLRAVRIHATRAWHGTRQHLARSADDAHGDARDRHEVPWLHDRPLRSAIKGGIRLLHELVGGRRRLRVRAVVDEVTDGDPPRQRRHPAEVIAVVVRRDQMIDLRQARIRHGRGNPPRVPDGAGAAVPRVNEERFTGWRHEKSGVAPFHVDEVHLQRADGALGGGNGREARRNRSSNGDTHGAIISVHEKPRQNGRPPQRTGPRNRHGEDRT
jgi:hypothetical protein